MYGTGTHEGHLHNKYFEIEFLNKKQFFYWELYQCWSSVGKAKPFLILVKWTNTKCVWVGWCENNNKNMNNIHFTHNSLFFLFVLHIDFVEHNITMSIGASNQNTYTFVAKNTLNWIQELKNSTLDTHICYVRMRQHEHEQRSFTECRLRSP